MFLEDLRYIKMTNEPTHRFFGITATEWITRVPKELPFDAVGMWQIVGVGRHDFELEGAKLDEFVAAAVRELLRHGALPVTASDVTHGSWRVVQLGSLDAEQIVNEIIQDWKARGRGESPSELWFAIKDVFDSPKS